MKKLFAFILLVPLMSVAQTLNYAPNRKLDKTVPSTYYDTEYIFIKNISQNSINLSFELLENTLLGDWSATICTNQQCYSILPKSGELGSLAIDQEAYFSFNFAANQKLGSGVVRYLITSNEDSTLHDTLTFHYTVTEDGKITSGPWAKVNFNLGVLTVLLENPYIETTMRIYNVQGEEVYNSKLNPITSIPLRDFGAGMYLIYIEDEINRILKQKVVHFE